MTSLICLDLLNEAYRNLEDARRRYTEAAMALTVSREKLDHVLDHAYQQQSFRPIEALFCEEEAALAVYEQAIANLAQAEGRWCALRAALAYEKELLMRGPPLRERLN